MIFAAVDWGAVAAIGAVVVTIIGSLLSYRLGRRADESLNLARESDRRSAEMQAEANRRSTEVQAALDAQDKIIDQLQEEVARHLASVDRMRLELDAKREEIRTMRRRLAESEAAAARVIEGLEQQLAQMSTIIERHEETIASLQEQLAAARGGPS